MLVLDSSDPDILALFDAEQRRDVRFFDSVREETPQVVRHVGRFGGKGFVVHWNMTGTDVTTVVREQIAYFESIGQDFEWKIYGYDRPFDLGKLLVQMGFKAEPEETVVYRDLATLPEQTAIPSNATVERIKSPSDVGDVIAMIRSIWDEDHSSLESSFKTQLQEDAAHLGLYVARASGAVVSAGWVNFHEKGSFASLWGGATVPAWRRRGLYRALVAARAVEAQRRGYKYVTVDAAPTSRPILERLGFKVLAPVRGYVWSARRRSCDPENANAG